MEGAAALLQLISQPLHQRQRHRIVPYAAGGNGCDVDVSRRTRFRSGEAERPGTTDAISSLGEYVRVGGCTRAAGLCKQQR